jgi:CubicO group peptidase (beta-lactamase class C family)
MKKLIIASLVTASLGATAAEFHDRDRAFIDNAANHMITVDNWDTAENSASTFPHAYKFAYGHTIKAGGVAPEDIKKGKPLDLSQIMVSDIGGEMPLNTYLRDRMKNHSMVVLKDGVMVHDHYWNGTKEGDTHLMMSVTKSFTSILAAIAVDNGLLDMDKMAVDYLPELTGTAWESATVQEIADMRTSLKIEALPGSSWDSRMVDSQGYYSDEKAAPYPNGINDYFPFITETVEPMGKKYTYQCVNTEVLGKIVEAATGKQIPDLLETQIWQKVGVENDAEIMASANGGVMASGGLNASTKDLARVGKVILNEGKNYKGEQIIPKAFIDSTYEGNDEVRKAWAVGKEAALADGWYMNQFRVLHVGEYKVMAMIGIHGQVMVADLESNTVIAMNGGYPMTETPRMAQGIFHKTIPAILDAVKAL